MPPHSAQGTLKSAGAGTVDVAFFRKRLEAATVLVLH
jgi:hypothetical protein